MNLLLNAIVQSNQAPETISKGHLLRPRSILFADGEIQQLENILEKMLALGGDRREIDRLALTHH